MIERATPRHATGVRRRGTRPLGLVAILSLVASLVLLISGASFGAPSARADDTADSSFSKTVTVTRDHLIGGADSVVDTRQVSVHVDVTDGLRNRQGVGITWSGARPTAGIVYDNNSPFAANQEYPVVILQCRGVDSASAPAEEQLSPRTCFTQTPELRYQPWFRGDFPAYRLDRYATAADREQKVGAPATAPASCSQGAGAERWVPFDAADGTTYYGGPLGCAGLAPEQSVLADPATPSNATFGTTGADGQGSARFVVQDSQSNGSLGCSATVRCAIVIIPIVGISCDASAADLPPADRPTDAAAAQTACGTSGFYQPGQPNGGQSTADPNSKIAVNGQLWWSASNWRNRITVPITLAQTSAVCDLTGGSSPENIYGSQLMLQVTQQWAPTFCLDPQLFRLQQVQTPEVQAKNLLATGLTNGQYLGVKAIFQAGAPSTRFTNPVVQAPTAVTGFAIAFAIDDQQHHAVTDLKLNARLLAKLMTMSYPAYPAVRDGWSKTEAYKPLAKNPLDMSVDPEFVALNPNAATNLINQLEASATLFSMSSDSDVMTALTSYLQADPEARSWLDGKPDPWGMVVNPNYRKIALPTSSWPLLDNYYDPLGNECIADQHLPILPLVASPVSDPSLITYNMQYGITNSQVNCTVFGSVDSADSRRLTAAGRQNPGIRFLLGVVGLGDAARYQLSTAALQTHNSSTSSAPFTDASNRSFVAASDDSVLAAARLMKPDFSVGTWQLPYHDLATTSAGQAAYPGTMLISTDIPTKGLASDDATKFANFLNYVAGPGQTRGLLNGQLPDGYLPITSANGLGNLANYTHDAAIAVGSQSGAVPLLPGEPTPVPAASSASPSASDVSGPIVNSPTPPSDVVADQPTAAPKIVSTPTISAPQTKASQLSSRPAGATSAVAPDWLGYSVAGLALLGLVSAAGSAWMSGIGRRR